MFLTWMGFGKVRGRQDHAAGCLAAGMIGALHYIDDPFKNEHCVKIMKKRLMEVKAWTKMGL